MAVYKAYNKDGKEVDKFSNEVATFEFQEGKTKITLEIEDEQLIFYTRVFKQFPTDQIVNTKYFLGTSNNTSLICFDSLSGEISFKRDRLRENANSNTPT